MFLARSSWRPIVKTLNLNVWALPLIFLHEYTLFVIDMHQNRSISTLLTPFDHFQKRVFGRLISWHHLRPCIICQNHVLSVLVLFEFQSLSVVLQDESGNVEFPWVVFVIELLDNFVVIFFTFEFAIRLVICPNKRRCFLDLKKILSFIKSVFKSNLLRFIKYIFE